MEGIAALGTRVRVKIAGTRGAAQTGFDMQSTNTVDESSASSWTHYLYLGSSSIAEKDGTVTAEFNAEVAGEYMGGKNATTLVAEISPKGVLGVRHFVYLGSESVEKLEQYPDGGYRTKEEQAAIDKDLIDTAVTAPIVPDIPFIKVTQKNAVRGAKIRVKLTGTVGEKTEDADMYGTVRVRENNPFRWMHFLFLGSNRVGGAATPERGEIVNVEFDAMISGDYQSKGINNTEVREIRTDGSFGFTHFMFLSSDCISLLAEDPAQIQAETEIAQPSKIGSTMSIDRYDDEISFSNVEERIEELEEATETEWEVIRVRNDETLATYGDEDDAREYITDNDYDPERVIVRETDPDEEDVTELSQLGQLNADCNATFGSAWSNGNLTLLRNDYFDSDWARSQAANQLDIPVSDTNDWPFEDINWSDAAELKRDADYTLIDFDGAEFYGADQ